MMNFDHISGHVNLKWVIYINVQPKILNILKENLVENCCDLGLGKDFSNTALKSKIGKEKNDDLGFIKTNDLFFGRLQRE